METAKKPDEFSVDDLLDFSNHELVQLQDQPEEDPQQPQQHTILCSPQKYPTLSNNTSVTHDFGSINFPDEDLESLEWLSQFVEDSFSGHPLTYPAPCAKPEQHRSEPERNVIVSPVQTKARSKRSRSGLRVWSPLEPEGKKKARKESGGAQQPRRCSHCGVQKTPQWRAGPSGTKTLCNACGVRFKSGRLLPEYRPASSPTFSNELHSNSHRRVLEIRRKKEIQTGEALPVQSF